MNKMWRIIILIVIIALILGALCIGVGFMTGAETDRIIQVLDNRYNFDAWRSVYHELMSQLQAAGVIS